MTRSAEGPVLTLEPLIQAIRDAVERVGWRLSGLQKTTSHQFEGRWEGESTRSAYLFFHPPDGPDFVSVDVYLDETGRGLTGNLALVVDLASFRDLGSVSETLEALASASRREVDPAYRRPVTLRFRLGDAGEGPSEAETEARLKVRIPKQAMTGGAGHVTVFALEVMRAFERLLGSEELLSRIPEA